MIISLRLPKELLERLKDYALKSNKTLTEVIIEAIKEYLA